MKLAKALADRAHLQQRLSELEARLNRNAKVLEGEDPAEDPADLLMELDDVLRSLEELVAKINLVNSRTRTPEGLTLTELLAKRDVLSQRLRVMRSFLGNASSKVERFTKTELAIRSTVNVTELQKEVDDWSRELRLVDERIQELNWTTEV